MQALTSEPSGVTTISASADGARPVSTLTPRRCTRSRTGSAADAWASLTHTGPVHGAEMDTGATGFDAPS